MLYGRRCIFKESVLIYSLYLIDLIKICPPSFSSMFSKTVAVMYCLVLYVHESGMYVCFCLCVHLVYPSGLWRHVPDLVRGTARRSYVCNAFPPIAGLMSLGVRCRSGSEDRKSAELGAVWDCGSKVRAPRGTHHGYPQSASTGHPAERRCVYNGRGARRTDF